MKPYQREKRWILWVWTRKKKLRYLKQTRREKQFPNLVIFQPPSTVGRIKILPLEIRRTLCFFLDLHQVARPCPSSRSSRRKNSFADRALERRLLSALTPRRAKIYSRNSQRAGSFAIPGSSLSASFVLPPPSILAWLQLFCPLSLLQERVTLKWDQPSTPFSFR